MNAQLLKNKILETLKTDNRLWDEKTQELNQTLLLDLVENIDEKVIKILLEEDELRNKFFVKIKNAYVFKTNDFKFFMEENRVYNSYTKYKNRIGLTNSKKFLKDSADVVLDFPYKDCVLEGGQSTEEGLDSYYEYDESVTKTEEKKGYKAKSYNLKQSKRKEIFFNQVLAQDEIDRLFDEKALVNWKRFTKEGEFPVENIKRDKEGTIKENLIIKGNNLLALHSLRSQFKGKIKLIYIDPPYNTGNDSFHYNDNFNHSTWLTFMKNRLEVAKELLRPDGVIFVQCDDNEQAYLKVLMDDIFNNNFISNSSVVINRGGRDYGGIAKTHEYLLIYGNKPESELNLIQEDDKKFNYQDSIGGFNLMELRNRNIKFNDKNRPNLCYPFYVNPSKKDENNLYEISLVKNNDFSFEVYPLKSQGIQTVWRWGKEKAKEYLNIDVKAKLKQDGSYMIVQKYRKNLKRQRSIWDDKNFVNEKGTLHIKLLFGDKLFDYPKSEFLLEKIIELGSNKDDIVLDYHLGSGTTCAVTHKMGRQYIGIEQMDYLKNITCERLKKVIDGEQGGISKYLEWKGGGDFIYLELAKWNEKAKEEINSCKSFLSLIELFDSLYEKYFLNYNLKIKEFKEKVIKEDNFKALPLEEQKKMFLTMLDLNQMYVQKTEMEDSKFGISDEYQELTNEFYNGGK